MPLVFEYIQTLPDRLLAFAALMARSGQKLSMFMLSHFFPSFLNDTAQVLTPFSLISIKQFLYHPFFQLVHPFFHGFKKNANRMLFSGHPYRLNGCPRYDNRFPT